MPSLLVNIDVCDLARAERFYSEALALTPARRFGDGAVEMLGAGAPVYLLLKQDGSPAIPAGDARRDYSRHWTPVHLDFVVADIGAAIERAIAAGALQEGPVKDAEWGRLALMADPFGHGFCLIEFTARGYDAIAR